MENLQNVKKFNPNFQIENWCYENLKRVEEVENYKFYNDTKVIKNYFVAVDKIVGTRHERYIGKRWLDLPYSMKRFYDYYTVDNFLNFSHTDDFTRKGMGYEKYGDYFFTSGGNHRTCQAKFSGLKNIKVDITENIFDQRMFDVFNFLINEGLMPIISECRCGKHYRSCSWTIHMNSREYYFQSFSTIVKFVDYYRTYAPSLVNNIFARFSKKEILFSYNEEKDYVHLKNAIILYKLSRRY